MADEDRIDVCLVVPPFDAIRFPPLGSAILATACRAKGLKVRIVYGSIALASRLGYQTYRSVCTSGFRWMLGEHLFAPHAYAQDTVEALGPADPLPAQLQALYQRVAGEIGPFLDDLSAEVIALRPRILGFSTNFQQTLAAAGIARRVKAAAPETCIVFGGANVAGRMAHGLAQVFTCVDHFFAGEADTAFPAFCQRYVRDGRRPPQRVISCSPIKDMREVHQPDFTEYFSALREQQNLGHLPRDLPEFLTMESSRGCWWGEKHHCTFCGLNADGMEYRRKDAGSVLEELKHLTSSWNVEKFFMADNIMPMSYLNDLLPTLERWEGRPRLFYEVKSNLREDQLVTMARGGVDRIQPGIESFSTNVLRLMRKGVSGLQNLALLRMCRSIGISVAWNYLYGFPGERLEDYSDVARLIPALEHLDPPSGCVAVIIDRFSPYFNSSVELGIGEVTPRTSYRGLYPQTAPLNEIAFHFSGAYSTPLLADEDSLAKFRAAIDLWREQCTPKRRPVLVAIDKGAGGVAVADTRRIAKARMTVLSRAMYDTLRHFDRAKAADALDGPSAEHVEFLLDRSYLVQHEGLLLSVVTRLESAPVSLKARPEGLKQPVAA